MEQEFLIWAFGSETVFDENPLEALSYWNKTHGHLKTFSENDSVAECIKFMIEAFCKKDESTYKL